MFREMNSPVKEIKSLADERVATRRLLQIMVVTAVDFEDPKTGLISQYKCSVRSLVTKVQYDNVPMLGIGLGNYKGVLKYPEVNDMVVIAFLDETPNPIVLGSLPDFFTQTPDNIPQIKRNEFLVANKMFGSVFYMLDTNEIHLKASDPVDGNFKDALGFKRAEVKLKPGSGVIPGSIEISTDGLITQTVGGAWVISVAGLANINVVGALAIQQPTTGAGFFIDALGNVTIKGTTVNFVQV